MPTQHPRSPHRLRRAFTVAVLSAGLSLPGAVAVAAVPATSPSCDQLGSAVSDHGLDCTPLRHDGVDGIFVAPRAPGSTSSGGNGRHLEDGETDDDADGEHAGDTPTAAPDAGGSGGATDENTLPGAGACPTTTGTRGTVAPATATPGTATTADGGHGPGSATAVTTGATTTTATAAATPSAARVPGDLLDLTDWYLTLPTGAPGDPDTVENPALARFAGDFFHLTPQQDGVVFSANAGGVTTKHSHYPRSELREMNGDRKASWSNAEGTHTLEVCEAFLRTPSAKPEVVGVQIHDASDDVLQIRIEGRRLVIRYDDGKSEQVLDDHYELGSPFRVTVVAAERHVAVSYNGRRTVDLPLAGSGWYWKVGAYVQSNPEKGDDAASTGAVAVYALAVRHDR